MTDLYMLMLDRAWQKKMSKAALLSFKVRSNVCGMRAANFKNSVIYSQPASSPPAVCFYRHTSVLSCNEGHAHTKEVL